MAATTKTPRSRNQLIGPHVNRLSKSQLYAKKALYKRPHKPIASSKPAETDLSATKIVKVGGAKNGGERHVPVHKAPKFYPGEDTPRPKQSRKVARAPGLRSTLTPGTVVIILAGRFRGKRAVFLKQLASGLLLISGPFKLNGVPLRRVNQAYVIATQTKIDLDAKLDDAYFSKDKKTRDQRAKAKEFFAENGEREKKKFPESKIGDQKEVDKELIAVISKTPNLAKFLASPFGLSKGDLPHLMKF
ncbi:hypothetical protein CROQUDRAFT_48077 [Cronartium quercuum f. sp. fusiforme G11]|uniref:Large ribosomal subunit protein uL6 N-terminal domain-containing protein n=1 Tax=Cronartium quercuum f. sp. fusiforme G11 TaxID=708437 RepID=A0A9P6T994_9BASI|nr:hypothetical protein CROQUDRAFT_48077 [Cronartium quercuum f. sp. fusiforme G11]